MAVNSEKTRLSEPDPWDAVAGAREQRGPIVVRWCMAVLADLRIHRSRADAVPQHAFCADTAGRARRTGSAEVAGEQGAGT